MLGRFDGFTKIELQLIQESLGLNHDEGCNYHQDCKIKTALFYEIEKRLKSMK